MSRCIFLCLSVALLSACANQETVLRNTAGDSRYCYLVHSSGIERVAATDQYTKCMNEAGTAGFRRVDK